MQLGSRRATGRTRMAAAAAVSGAMLLATAACGGGTSAQAGGKAGDNGSGNGIKGKRFILMVQSTPNPNKVVEAHAIKLLKDQGVDAQLKWNASTTNIAITQLIHGDIDAYAEAVTGGINAALTGIPLKDFALMQPREDYVFIAKPGINTLQDLKGKKIGVQDTTGINYAQALIILGKAGLSQKDVQIVAAGGQSSRLPALIGGRVDATMLSHAAQIQLEPDGYKVLFDFTKQASELYDDNAFAMDAWLKSNPDLAVAFNKALLDSFKWFDDPANADEVLNEAMALAPASDKDQTKQLFDMLRQADAYPEGAVLDTSVLNSEMQLFEQAQAISGTLPVDQWADDSFAKKAEQQ